MPNDSITQSALAYQTSFQRRIGAALSKVAWAVLGENPATTNHAERAAYARTVLTNVGASASQIAPWLVERPNLLAFATSYDFPSASIVTAAGDADIESQLTTDWNTLAGV